MYNPCNECERESAECGGCVNQLYYGGKNINTCKTCKHTKGENNLICTCVDSDNNTDFVAAGMTCECHESVN